jgi:hypothetical protein
MLQHVAVVDHIDRIVRNEGEVVDGGDVIDVRIIDGVDVNEAGNVAFATA